MVARLLRFLIYIAVAVLVAAVFTLVLSWAWMLTGGGALSAHGWIALLLGVFGTLGLAWALMALAFKSNREGWDDRVDNTLDPGRGDADQDDRS